MSARGVKSLITTLHDNPQLVDTRSTMQLHQHKNTKTERFVLMGCPTAAGSEDFCMLN